MFGVLWALARLVGILAILKVVWGWFGVSDGVQIMLAFLRSLDPRASGADLCILIVIGFGLCAGIALVYYVIGNMIALQVVQARKRRGL